MSGNLVLTAHQQSRKLSPSGRVCHRGVGSPPFACLSLSSDSRSHWCPVSSPISLQSRRLLPLCLWPHSLSESLSHILDYSLDVSTWRLKFGPYKSNSPLSMKDCLSLLTCPVSEGHPSPFIFSVPPKRNPKITTAFFLSPTYP